MNKTDENGYVECDISQKENSCVYQIIKANEKDNKKMI